MLKDIDSDGIVYNPEDNYYTKCHLWRLGVLDKPPVLDTKGIRLTLTIERTKEPSLSSPA